MVFTIIIITVVVNGDIAHAVAVNSSNIINSNTISDLS